MAIMAIFQFWPLWPVDYDHKYSLDWCSLKLQQKCRSTVKTVSKIMEMAKSYGQNKTFTEIMAISLVFLPRF